MSGWICDYAEKRMNEGNENLFLCPRCQAGFATVICVAEARGVPRFYALDVGLDLRRDPLAANRATSRMVSMPSMSGWICDVTTSAGNAHARDRRFYALDVGLDLRRG